MSLQVADWTRRVEEARDRLLAEEDVHRSLASEIERNLGHLRKDVADLQAMVQRLEDRLDRLTYASRPLSDDELDDQDYDERVASAAFWAEWRQQREERKRSDDHRRPRRAKSAVHSNGALRQLYRQLARLIHPDLGPNPEERARRESAMRLANMAYEAGDESQLERLLTIWERNEEPPETSFQVEDLKRRLEKLQQEIHEIESRHADLDRSETGELLRLSAGRRRQHIEREAERLRRELASLRLRRRRLQRSVDAMREDLSEVSD